MQVSKIDKIKLSQLLRSGKSPAECARHFNVTQAAICQARKKLNISIVKNVVLETAHKVVDKHLNTISQLQKINQNANAILDSLMAWGQGDTKALPILESQVRKILGPGKELKEYKYKDPRELALKAMAEIRGQLSLQLNIYQTMYDMAAVAEFQKTVLEIIGEVAPDVRTRIINKLKESRALRSSVSISTTGL